jgi:hypothetical protein
VIFYQVNWSFLLITAIMTDMNITTAETKTDCSVDKRCRQCFVNAYNRLFDKFHVDKDQRLYFYMLYQEVLLKYKNL